jgi:hypothetical protein
VELPQRKRSTDADAPASGTPEPRAAATPSTSLGGRFERGLRRTAREQTSMLSWLAESDDTEALRGASSAAEGAPTPEIDLRETPSVESTGFDLHETDDDSSSDSIITS